MIKVVESSYSKRDICLEYYVVSSGLEEIISGCKKISKHLAGFWGCRLAPNKPGGPVKYIKKSINFTEKTRYLFDINKGLPKSDTDKNPFEVNKNIAEKDRRVPFENMIYVGDGLTDIPCMSLVRKGRGLAFGILHKGRHGAAKRAIFKNLITQDRALSFNSPKYGKNDDLRAILNTAIVNRCVDIELQETQEYS